MSTAPVRIDRHRRRAVEDFDIGRPAIRNHHRLDARHLVQAFAQQQHARAMFMIARAMTRPAGNQDDLLVRPLSGASPAHHHQSRSETQQPIRLRNGHTRRLYIRRAAWRVENPPVSRLLRVLPPVGNSSDSSPTSADAAALDRRGLTRIGRSHGPTAALSLTCPSMSIPWAASWLSPRRKYHPAPLGPEVIRSCCGSGNATRRSSTTPARLRR